MSHRVTAAAVQVNVGNRVHTVFRGHTLPEGVAADTLDALTAKGLIESVAGDESTSASSTINDEAPAGKPDESWTSKQLDAYAEANSIDLGKAKSKADKLAAIAAAAQA